MLNHNALLRKLDEAGNVDEASGGTTLDEELDYQENATFMYYDGYETLNVAASDTFTTAQYPWKQAAVNVVISGRESRINSGREQMIRLLNSRIKNAEKTMMNNLSTGIYSDGTGSSGKQIGGLQLLVADDPTTGTVGGINRATWSFWRNSLYDFSVESVTPSSTTIQGAMNTLWLRQIRGMDHPDCIVAGSTYFDYFWQSLQAIQRITSDTKAASGYETVTYYGPGGRSEVMYDSACLATRLYMLNTDYFFWRPHRDANMEPLVRRESVNQDASVVPIIFQGNLTMSNSARQGVMIA